MSIRVTRWTPTASDHVHSAIGRARASPMTHGQGVGGSSLAWPSAFVAPWSSLFTTHVPRPHLRPPPVGATVIYITTQYYSVAISSYEVPPLEIPRTPQIYTDLAPIVQDHDPSGLMILVHARIWYTTRVHKGDGGRPSA